MTSVPAIAPQAPTIASHGLTITAGSGSIVRAPGLSSRMKQSCRLVKSALAASSRFGSAKSRQTPIDRSRTIGLSILLNQPMNWVVSWRGMRLVSKKVEVFLQGDASEDRANVHGSVHSSRSWNETPVCEPRGETMSWPVYIAGAAALAGALPRLKSRLELSKAKHPSLRGHSRIGRFLATLVPFYEYDESQVFRSDDAPDEVADQRHAGFMRLAALYRERFAKSVAMTDDAKESISDLQFTASYRVPFQYSRYVRAAPARRLVRGVVVGRRGSPISTATASTT